MLHYYLQMDIKIIKITFIKLLHLVMKNIKGGGEREREIRTKQSFAENVFVQPALQNVTCSHFKKRSAMARKVHWNLMHGAKN